MNASIIGTALDLLRYDSHGNFLKFDRCFSKALHFYSVSLEEEVRRKLRNIAFHFLRTTGYLDVSYSGSLTKWSIAPSSITELGDGTFAFIGSSNELKKIRTILEIKHLKEINDNYSKYLPVGVGFYPGVTLIGGQRSVIEDVAEECGIVVSHSYQDRLFELLPHLSKVLQYGMVKEDGALFESCEASLFDFQKQEWVPYLDTRPIVSGLFKRKFDYHFPDYFLSEQTAKHFFQSWKIVEPDWTFIIALTKTKRKANLIYSEKEKTLTVPKLSNGLRYPTLIDRCFRSGTLTNPILTGNHFVYSSILQKNIWKLVAKFPIFEVTES